VSAKWLARWTVRGASSRADWSGMGGHWAFTGSAADGPPGPRPAAGPQRHPVEAVHRRGRDLPERYGPWKTVYERFRRWSADGTWDRLLAHVQQHSDAVGVVDWTVVSIDSTTVRAQASFTRSVAAL